MVFQTSFSDMTGALGDLFGSSQSGETSGSENSTTKSTTKESYKLSQEALDKIIEDALSSTGGLKEIFSDENASGLYNTTVAREMAGDLLSKIIGEVAAITSTKTTQTDSKTKTKTSGSSSSGNDGGILGSIGSVFGL